MDLTSATAIAALYQFDHLQCRKGMLINACIQEHGVYMHTRTLVRCLHVTNLEASLVLALGQHVRNMHAGMLHANPKVCLVSMQLTPHTDSAADLWRERMCMSDWAIPSRVLYHLRRSRGHACDNYKTRRRSIMVAHREEVLRRSCGRL